MRLSDAQLELLAFVASLTVAPKSCLEARYGAGVTYDLKKLKAAGLACHRPLAGRSNVWQLTAKGCRAIGISESRARRLGGQALHNHVTIAQLVTRFDYRLVEREKIKELLPGTPLNVTHVLGSSSNGSILFRVLTPGLFTHSRSIARQIAQLVPMWKQLDLNPNEYGCVIAVQDIRHKKAIVKALKAAKLYGQGFALRIEVLDASAKITD